MAVRCLSAVLLPLSKGCCQVGKGSQLGLQAATRNLSQ